MRCSHCIVVVALWCASLSVQAAVVVITPAHFAPWQSGPLISPCGFVSGSTMFVNGPATPPLGTGSFEFDIPPLSPHVFIHNSAINGVPLGNITALRYSTYVTASSLPNIAPRMILTIDTQDPMMPFDQIEFIPASQGPVTTGVWQQWNAGAGVWHSLFAFPAPPPFTLASYLAAHPGARIMSLPSPGGLAVIAGCDGSTQQASIDAVTFAISGASTTYDFELVEPASTPIPTLEPWGIVLLICALIVIGHRLMA